MPIIKHVKRSSLVAGVVVAGIAGAVPVMVSASSNQTQGQTMASDSGATNINQTMPMMANQSTDTALQATSGFETSWQEASKQFRSDVADQLNMAYHAVGSQNAACLYAFYDQMQQSNDTFDTTMQSAMQTYRMNIDKGMSGDEARNDLTDAMNHAKADYFNDLDKAKNQLAQSMNDAGQASAKDSFMNAFNSQRDHYGAMLETAKNDMLAETH